MPIAAIGNFCHRHWAETRNAMSTKFYAVDRQQGGKTFFQRTTFKDALKHLLFFAVVSNVFSALVLHFIELYTQPTFELLTVQHSKSVLRDVQTLCEDLGGKDFSLQFRSIIYVL